jgi:hypothetical protein
MASYALVRCALPLIAEAADIPLWRTRSLAGAFQTFEVAPDGALRQFRLARRLHEGHPPRPALLDPSYTDWLQEWTTLEAISPDIVNFTGTLELEGRDKVGTEWVAKIMIENGQCHSYDIAPLHTETRDRAA